MLHETGVNRLVEEKMHKDETTAIQLHQLLTAHGTHSKTTVLCCRSSHGWTFRGSSYCQVFEKLIGKEERKGD